LTKDVAENYSLPGFAIEAFQCIKQGGIVDHPRDLRVATIAELGNQGQNIIGSIFLNAIRRTLPPKKTMGRKQPKACLVGRIEIS
jgi:hypothetical protein